MLDDLTSASVTTNVTANKSNCGVVLGKSTGRTAHELLGLDVTTAVLAERVGAKNVVGVDLAMESVEKARASYPDLRFEQLDIFEEGAAAALQKLAPAGFGRVFIDINGSRMLPAVLEALRLAVEELGAPVVVVKSRALHAHL